MDCTRCGRANRPSARFCGGCGASLTPRCPACGVECEAGTQFCDACGTAIAARPSGDAVARKVVTIVFADVVGSTSLHERLDAESARRVMDGYYRALHVAVEAHGGTVVKLLGDGVMAAFGVPRVAEDDAVRAVRAAVDMQRAFRELVREQRATVGDIGLRVAVNTGEVVVRGDHDDVVGDPVNVAARLQQEAQDGDVLVGEATRRLVGHLVTLAPFGALALKGRTEAVAAYRVLSLERPAGAATVPFVGRDDEIRRLLAVYDGAVVSRTARLAVVLGSPGLGKSRLLGEVARCLDPAASVLAAHCDAAGGATFAPIAEAIRAHLGLDTTADADTQRAAVAAVLTGDDAERSRVANGVTAMLAGAPAAPEETFFVVRRLLGALGASRPVVLLVDDVQWAEPLLLDLTEHLVQWSTDVPLLVLVAARPELRDLRSSLAAPGRLVADVVTLGGLDAAAATQLAAHVIGADALPAAVAGRVLATSEGNPLFLGELVRMLVQDGALVREGDRWTAGVALATLEMPPTIHALLAARIERLRPEERVVLERAAIVGRQFSRSAVAHLMAPETHLDLDARLEALRRSELVEPDAGWFLGEPALRFHHLLVRDAAYRRVLKGTRAELHARFADWVEARALGAAEHDETIGWHLEQAHQHLRELGPLDDPGRATGERAARHLAAAGRRALARDDLPLAASLLGRAIDRLDAADPARADLALDWCEALLAAGDVGPAASAVAELGRFRHASERLGAWHTCFAGQLAALTDPQALRTAADAVAAAADILAAAGDAAGEAKAHSVAAAVLARLGKVGACEAALDRALAAARRAHDRRRANAVLAGAPPAALWGPSPVARASGRCLDVVRVLRITQGAPAVEAVALRCQAVLEALRGRTDAARRMIASSRRMVEELGITQRLLEADVFAGMIELLEGDAPAAERLLRAAYDGLREQGLRIDAAQAAALLGRALLALGRVGEAEAVSHESEALAGDDLKAASAWRCVRAEALARRGEHAAAVECARTAVDVAAATDALLDHADARFSLAAALRAAGSTLEAQVEEARAIELWEAKGATLLADRVRRGTARIAPSEPPAEEGAARPGSMRRRVRPNAATGSAAHVDAAVAVRDAGTVPLASLGESLALVRGTGSFGALPGADLDADPVGAEEIALIEADGRGQPCRTETFAADRLCDAVARLFERYAERLPDGSDHDRAAATARSVVALLGPPDLERYRAAFADDIEFVDHRTMGFPSGRGVDRLLRGFRGMFELASDVAIAVDDILCLQPDALLVRWRTSGTDRVGGGTYEYPLLLLWVIGPDGRVTHNEQFEADHDTEALARFDVLTAAPARPVGGAARRRVPPNGATANAARMDAVVAARDIDALFAVFADDAASVHHPTGSVYAEREARGSYEAMLRTEDLLFAHEPLATLGSSLALCHGCVSFSGSDDVESVGASNMDTLVLMEVDGRGQRVHTEFFAVDRLSSALCRLYERHAERLPAGPESARAAGTARSLVTLTGPLDPERYATALAENVEWRDHRALGFPEGHDRQTFLRGLRGLLDVTSDSATRGDDVVGLRPDALVVRWTNFGTDRAGGGAYERTFLLLLAFDADGLLARWEQFDPDRCDQALARFDELGTPAPDRFANAVCRAQVVFDRRFGERDWNGVVASFAPGFRLFDRRALTRLDLAGGEFLANLRLLFATPASEFRSEPLATRGDRLALFRVHFAGEIGEGGFFADEHLSVVEHDASGLRAAVVVFDALDLDAAHAEIDARYEAGEAAGYGHGATTREFRRAFAARDWDALAPLLAHDLVVRDHRLLGWETIRGPAAYVLALRSLVELAPDVRLRLDHVVAMSDRRVLYAPTWVGTREGGAFEAPSVIVGEIDPLGRFGRFDQYDLAQLGEARAHFAEGEICREDDRPVAAAPRPDPLRIPPNAATRAGDRWEALATSQDWKALDTLFAPAAVFEDRRRGLRLAGDREMLLASIRLVASSGGRVAGTRLATAGDRLVLDHAVFTGPEGAPAYEVEALQITEVDAEGRVVATVSFDPEDRRAAALEMFERYVRGEAASWMPAAVLEMARAMYDHDLVRLRGTLDDGFVMQDHRRTGVGRLASAVEYVASLAALFELAPDAGLETLYTIAGDTHASLAVARMAGTGVEGGAFESVFARLFLFRGHKLVGAEIFELTDLDRALARFDELCSNSA